jgi:hypothetical protein
MNISESLAVPRSERKDGRCSLLQEVHWIDERHPSTAMSCST